MPRARDEMQVNVAGLRRNIKNLAHNYSDAQVKVREATSNDPWGPSSTLMAEIADLTYNMMAFTEIMQMIWKRLNDHGKNWRHVYKALVLMEYLIKTGTEKVAMQCKENIFAIHTLKDFQYMEEGKDQGLNVREKAKQLVNLLKDEERLRNERARALKAKQRFAQTPSAFGSDAALDSPASPPATEWGGAELARPLTAGEEELQLQLALAMSREEAEREERRRRSDDVRLQLAISQSQHDFRTPGSEAKKPEQQSHLLDLLDVNLAPAPAAAAPAPADPWGLPSPPQRPIMHLDLGRYYTESMETSPDAWSAVGSPARDPWAPAASLAAPLAAPLSAPLAAPLGAPLAAAADPWAPVTQSKSPLSMVSSPSSDLEQFDALSRRTEPALAPLDHATSAAAADPFDLSLLDEKLPSNGLMGTGGAVKKSPAAFLGENSALVNLERLLQPAADPPPHAPNPFAERQLFAPPPPAKLSINEIKQQQMGFPAGGAVGGVSLGAGAAAQADPWAPARSASPWSPPPARHTPNPFLS
ncbi:epsin-1 isoform X2 [Aricia agestis]|nr:epsin-1 isoform X2 [Aricia agestis]XP_041978503.1 epsin-1 isoform X2 [Aricia agestis]XP_041978504.1 epsin-1 isoform X2 [Aricia agestis]